MLIIQLAGGLGNQMQQYALYEKLKSMGKDCKIDISWFMDEKQQENVFAKRKLELDLVPNVSYEICTQEEREELLGNGTVLDKFLTKLLPDRKKVFVETDMYHPEIFSLEDAYLTGYFACQKYYADIMPLLCQRFAFPVENRPENEHLACEMRECNSVSLHIRRGDYLDPANFEMFGNICTDRYYETAIQRIKAAVPDARFYIFSDDMEYVKTNYSGDEFIPVELNNGDNSYFDIYLMSQCKHNICANSTFSLWGARLNQNEDSIRIRPLKHKNSQNPTPDQMKDYLSGWEVLDNMGNRVC